MSLFHRTLPQIESLPDPTGSGTTAQGEAWGESVFEGLEPELGVKSKVVETADFGRVAAEAGGAIGPSATPAKYRVRAGVIFAVLAAAAVACAYLGGVWEGALVGRQGVANAGASGVAGDFRGVRQKGKSETLAKSSGAPERGSEWDPRAHDGRDKDGQNGRVGGGVPPGMAGDGDGRGEGRPFEKPRQGQDSESLSRETDLSGNKEAAGNGAGQAWGPLPLVRNSSRDGQAQGANAGRVGTAPVVSRGEGVPVSNLVAGSNSESSSSPLLEALADGRIFEALPSDLKRQIQGGSDPVSVAPAMRPPGGGLPSVEATASGQPSEPPPNLSGSPGRPPVLLGLSQAGGPEIPPLPGALGPRPVPPGTQPWGVAPQGNQATGLGENLLSDASVSLGPAGFELRATGFELRATGAGYEAADEAVAFKLRMTGAGFHGQVSAKDGTVLSEGPILTNDSFRALGRDAKHELTGGLPTNGE